MTKYIVLFFVALAILSASFVSSASEVKESPSGVTGYCIFEYGVSVYCPKDTTPVTVAPRQAWEMTHDISSTRASHPIRFAFEGGGNGGNPS